MMAGINRDQVSVDPSGTWKRFIQIAPANHKPEGTVRVGSGREGALFLDKKSGTYVMIDGYGRTLPLDQRRVRIALGLPEPVGQPRKGSEVREVYSIRLEPSLAKYLRELGGDNLSGGITKLAESHRRRVLQRETRIDFVNHDPSATNAEVSFLAIVGPRTRTCKVSYEALRDHFGLAPTKNPQDLVRAFIAGKSEIHKVAREKLLTNSDETVLLGSDDFR